VEPPQFSPLSQRFAKRESKKANQICAIIQGVQKKNVRNFVQEKAKLRYVDWSTTFDPQTTAFYEF
jgi:carbamoylphosphate synthase small subunit